MTKSLAIQTAEYVRRVIRSVRQVLESPTRTEAEGREIALMALEQLHESLDPERNPKMLEERSRNSRERAEALRALVDMLPLTQQAREIALREISAQLRREERAELEA